MSNVVEQNNIVTLLKPDTQQKLIHGANRAGVSPDALLNTLLDDEVERQRLLNVFKEISQEKQQSSEKTAPSQKIAKMCNQYLSPLDHESESFAIRTAIENLHTDLLRQNLMSVNAREGSIVESKRLKTSRGAYYWYASILAKHTAMWFGALDVYLWHELCYPISEVVFVGMPSNVEVCYQVFKHLYKIFKKAKTAYKKDAGNWGSKADMEEEASRYMYNFAQELQETQAFIENGDYNKPLYDYADDKFAYAMRD